MLLPGDYSVRQFVLQDTDFSQYTWDVLHQLLEEYKDIMSSCSSDKGYTNLIWN